MKYKLIKKFPNSPDVGIVFHYFDNSYQAFGLVYRYTRGDVESNPEFFAPLAFKDENGVNVFNGDSFWVIKNGAFDFHNEPYNTDGDMYKFLADGKPEVTNGEKLFATKEAAQEYLEKYRNSFKENQWLLYKTRLDTWLFKFKNYRENGYINIKESYSFSDGKLFINTSGWFFNDEFIKVATVKEIQEMLIKVAKYKGFVNGVKVTEEFANRREVECTGDFCYYPYNDILYGAGDGKGGPVIYKQGKWATIEEDKEPEYVEVLTDIYPLSKGEICKLVDGYAESPFYTLKNGYLKYKYPDSNIFKPSTKEAYEAQFKPVPFVTTKVDEQFITVTFDNVDPIKWDIGDGYVKINYKSNK